MFGNIYRILIPFLKNKLFAIIIKMYHSQKHIFRRKRCNAMINRCLIIFKKRHNFGNSIGIFCSRHFENGLSEAMYSRIFAIEIFPLMCEYI